MYQCNVCSLGVPVFRGLDNSDVVVQVCIGLPAIQRLRARHVLFSLGRAPLPTPFLFPSLSLSLSLSFSVSQSIKALQGVPRQARHQASFPAPFSLRRRLQRHLLSSVSVAGLVLERALHEVSYLRAPLWGPVFLRAPGAVPYLLTPGAVPYFYSSPVPYFYAPLGPYFYAVVTVGLTPFPFPHTRADWDTDHHLLANTDEYLQTG